MILMLTNNEFEFAKRVISKSKCLKQMSMNKKVHTLFNITGNGKCTMSGISQYFPITHVLPKITIRLSATIT